MAQGNGSRGRPIPQVRRVGVADVRRDAWKLRRVRHAPAHYGKFALSFIDAHHRRHLIGENCGERRQVARIISRDLKQVADRFLVGRGRIEIAHGPYLWGRRSHPAL